MAARLHVCLEQRDQLVWTLARQQRSILTRLDGLNDTLNSRRVEAQKHELEWLLLETSIAEQLLNGQLRRVQGEAPQASLFGLDFRVICLAFEGERKHILKPTLLLSNELALLQVCNRHLQSDVSFRLKWH